MTTDELRSSLRGVRRSGKGWLALCPAHKDHNPSLSIKEGDDGRVLIHCHAGCSFEQVRAALAVEPDSLCADEARSSDNASRKHTDGSRHIVASYDYTDEQGKLLFQVVRYEPKDFRQRRPDEEGGWLWNLAGVRPVLYRLPELLAADPSSTAFICEGEKDADRLAGLGLIATTNPQGAGKWREGYKEPLRARHVCILPDNDDAGRGHANNVANSLRNVAASVRILSLPALPEKGDVSDWLDADGTVEELQGLAAATPEATENDTDSETGPDEDFLQRLAALPISKYERQRKDAAKTLGYRTPILDKFVETRRRKSDQNHNGLQGRAVLFADAELWPESVNGAAVLDEISETLASYIVLPDGAADALTLWCAHAHAFEVFACTPRLNVTSPEKQCGKTTLRDVLALLVPRALATENMSVAVLFRVIEAHRPTILADECDAWLRDNEELRGMLNAGHRRGGQALRCEGESNKVRAFDVFAPAVLCGIGSLPGTLHDRSIVIRLARAKAGELRERFDSRRTRREEELRRKLARFCGDNRPALELCDPSLPIGVFNRLADNWRPVFAIAEIAGGNWTQRAAAAFGKLTSKEDGDTQGIGTMLLADIRQVFTEMNGERIFSRELVEKLCAMTDRLWPEAHKGRAITEPWLASRLKTFGIKPKTLRIESDRAKGYELTHFSEAFERYLPVDGFSKRDNVTISENIGDSRFSRRDSETTCHASKTRESRENIDLSRGHVSVSPETTEDDVLERAAIMQYDGGLPREEAERLARVYEIDYL